MPPLTTDSARWRRVMFSRPGTMSIRMMSDSVRSVSSAVDTLQRRIVSHALAGANDEGVFQYEPVAGNRLRLHGAAGGDSVDVMLQRLDERRLFRLLCR